MKKSLILCGSVLASLAFPLLSMGQPTENNLAQKAAPRTKGEVKRETLLFNQLLATVAPTYFVAHSDYSSLIFRQL